MADVNYAPVCALADYYCFKGAPDLLSTWMVSGGKCEDPWSTLQKHYYPLNFFPNLILPLPASLWRSNASPSLLCNTKIELAVKKSSQEIHCFPDFLPFRNFNRPFRQAIYHLHKINKHTIEMDVFAFVIRYIHELLSFVGINSRSNTSNLTSLSLLACF